MPSIDLRPQNRRVVVGVGILPPDTGAGLRMQEGRALLDTGATNSGITTRLARSLGLKSVGKRPLVSAHGVAHVDRYVFRMAFPLPPEHGIPRFPYIFEEVEGFALNDDASFDALIGMDILTMCDLAIGRDGAGQLRFGAE